MYYKGTVTLTDGVKALLGGNPNAKTTEYGDSCTYSIISDPLHNTTEV